MADDSLKKLLVKLNISTADWKKSVQDIKAQLREMQNQALKDAQARLSAQAKELSQTKNQIADQKKLRAEAEAMAAVDKAKAAWQAQQAAATKTKIAQSQLETVELKKQGVEQFNLLKTEQQKLQIQQQQLRIQQSQVALAKAHAHAAGGGGGHAGGHGGGGIIGGALQGLAGGLFGGGLLGAVATGTAAGELFEKVLEKIGEKVRDLGKEMLEAAGPAGQLQEQFEKLAGREGVNPEEFLNKLRVATRGLVEDNTMLIKVANNFMQGPLRLQAPAIEKLVGLTVALARAQGKDATEAMNALSRAALTGRTQMLSWELGLTRSEVTVQGLGKGVSEASREVLQLDMIMDAMTRKLAEVGQPMTTVKDLFGQLNMVEAAFIEDMAYGLTHSNEFSKGLENISKWLMKITPEVLDFARGLGDKLGEAYYAVSTSVKAVLVPLYEFDRTLDKITKSILGMVGIKPDDFSFTWKQAMGALALEFITIGYWIEKAGTKMKMYGEIAVAVATGNVAGAISAYEAGQERLKKLDADLFKDVLDNAKFMTQPTQREPGEAGEHKTKPEVNQEILNERRQVALQLAEVEAKIRLEKAMQYLQDEEALEKQRYDRGLIDLKEYIEKEKVLKRAEFQDRKAEIEQERDAKLAALKLEQPGVLDPITKKYTGGMDPKVRADKGKLIREQAQAEILKAEGALTKEVNSLDDEMLQNMLAARRAYVAGINKIEQDGVKERIKLLDEEFKQGVGTADQYLAQKRSLIEQEYELRTQALAAEAEANKKNAAELAKIRIQFVQAEVDKEKQLQELEVHEGEIRLQSIKTRYAQAKEILESEALQAGTEGPLSEGKSQTAAIQAEQLLTSAYLQRLQGEQDRLEQSGKMYTSEWANINKEIYSAVQEQIKLNTEMAKAKDIAGPLSQLFGTIASEFDGILGVKAKNVLDTLTKSLATLSKVQTGIAAQTGGFGGLLKSTGHDIVGLFHKDATPQKAIETAQQIFENGLKSSAEKVQSFAAKVGAGFDATTANFGSAIDRAVEQLNSFSDAVANAANHAGGGGSQESPEAAPTGDSGLVGSVPGGSTQSSSDAGALSTATSGLGKFAAALAKAPDHVSNFSEKLKGVTEKVGGIVQGLGAVAQSILGAKTTGGGVISGGMSGMAFGAQFGPVAAAIGAGVGATLGALVGHKAQAVQQQIAGINTHLEEIKDNLQNGTGTLGQSITQLEALRQSAVHTLSGSKKGQKQLPPILEAINQELNQLLAQQKSLLDDLHNQLSIMLEPTAYQPILSQLDDIIKKYQEYASAAAGNTTEVANANSFLVQSLKQYAQTLSTDVNSAEQQAIQNKIQLLDLQQQEFQLTAQYNQQVYDIQTAGVTTRQRTTAMNKGEQLAQAKYQYDQQKQQLDAEINVTQMKVDAEKTIFGLASNRIDLENQLLQLQTVQETLSVQNIQALQKTLSQLNAALGPGGTIPAGLLNATGGVDIQALEQLLGLQITNVGSGTLPGGKPGQPTIANMPPVYSEFLQIFEQNAATAGFTQQLLAAAQTPFGSAQRNQLDNMLRNNPAYAKELIAAGAVTKPVNGVSQDPNWLSFFGWILNKAQATQATTSGGTGTNEPTVPTPSGTPGVAEGGSIRRTGAAIVHEGEGIFSMRAVPIFQKMVEGMSQFSDILIKGVLNLGTQPARPVAPVQIGYGGDGNLLNTHRTIYDLSKNRVNLESALLDKHRQVIQLDMQRIQALKSLGSSGGYDIESALADVYSTRGRMGAGGFTKENL